MVSGIVSVRFKKTPFPKNKKKTKTKVDMICQKTKKAKLSNC